MSDRIQPHQAPKPANLAPGHITWDEAKKMGELPSSSPIGSLESESSFQPILGDLDEDENETWRSRPEQTTVHLASAFLQYALDMVIKQDRTRTQICYRVESERMIALVGSDTSVKAEDDGGFCLQTRSSLGWKIQDPHVALLEAKRSFKVVRIDEDKVSPVFSDENIAQCLGEAVVAWRADEDLRERGG
jgi:hypothetical protein